MSISGSSVQTTAAHYSSSLPMLRSVRSVSHSRLARISSKASCRIECNCLEPLWMTTNITSILSKLTPAIAYKHFILSINLLFLSSLSSSIEISCCVMKYENRSNMQMTTQIGKQRLRFLRLGSSAPVILKSCRNPYDINIDRLQRRTRTARGEYWRSHRDIREQANR